MALVNPEKTRALVNGLIPEFKDVVIDFLQTKKAVPEADFTKMVALLADAFDELLSDTPNEKRADRKLRELIFMLIEIKYENDVQDEALKTATRFIREKLYRPSEKEKLSRLWAKDVYDNWCGLDHDKIEHIAGFDGILEKLSDLSQPKPDFNSPELYDLLLELTQILAARWLEQLETEEFDSVVAKGAEIAAIVERGEESTLGDSLVQFAGDLANFVGVTPLLRRAFAGLLLSDLIIRQVGKSLGISERLSVVDFIIFVIVRVFEKEELSLIDKAQIGRVRAALESVMDI